MITVSTGKYEQMFAYKTKMSKNNLGYNNSHLNLHYVIKRLTFQILQFSSFTSTGIIRVHHPTYSSTL